MFELVSSFREWTTPDKVLKKTLSNRGIIQTVWITVLLPICLRKYLLAVGLVRSIPSHTIFSSKGTIIATEAKQIKNLYAVCCMLYQYHISWWRHQMETFSALLALCAGNSPVPVNSPHKGQWRGALMFTLICARINDWVNNREAGDLKRHLDHYDVSVMCYNFLVLLSCLQWKYEFLFTC